MCNAYDHVAAFFGIALDAPEIALEAPPTVETVASDIDPEYAFFAVCRPAMAAIDGPRKIGVPVHRLSNEAQFNREASAIRLDIMRAKRIEDSRAA